MEKSKLQRLIEIKQQLAILKTEEKEIKEEILADADFQDEIVDGMVINKVTKRTPIFREGFDEEIIASFYPEVCTTKTVIKVDMNRLEKMPDAADYIEIKKSQYIMVAKVKEKK